MSAGPAVYVHFTVFNATPRKRLPPPAAALIDPLSRTYKWRGSQMACHFRHDMSGPGLS